MDFNKLFFYLFSFFLAVSIIQLVLMIKNKQVKSKRFLLFLVAAILFALNVWTHAQALN